MFLSSLYLNLDEDFGSDFRFCKNIEVWVAISRLSVRIFRSDLKEPRIEHPSRL
jgi:hypothetical protein